MKGNYASIDVLLEAITSIPLPVEKKRALRKMGLCQSTLGKGHRDIKHVTFAACVVDSHAGGGRTRHITRPFN